MSTPAAAAETQLITAAINDDQATIAQLLLSTPTGPHLDVNRVRTREELLLNNQVQKVRPKTPVLLVACLAGSLAAASVLLDFGANPDVLWRSQTPLLIAIRDDRYDLAELLLSKGANPNYLVNRYRNWTVLHWFCTARAPDADRIIPLLLRNHADINLHDREQNTPVLLALKCHNLLCAKQLLGIRTFHPSPADRQRAIELLRYHPRFAGKLRLLLLRKGIPPPPLPPVSPTTLYAFFRRLASRISWFFARRHHMMGP